MRNTDEKERQINRHHPTSGLSLLVETVKRKHPLILPAGNEAIGRGKDQLPYDDLIYSADLYKPGWS
jgi:hypothetical protein